MFQPSSFSYRLCRFLRLAACRASQVALAVLIKAIVVVFHFEPGAVTVLAICALAEFGLRMAGVI